MVLKIIVMEIVLICKIFDYLCLQFSFAILDCGGHLGFCARIDNFIKDNHGFGNNYT